MSPWIKFLIGLAAVLALGALHHGPLGNGKAFVDRLDQRARERLDLIEMWDIKATFGREPLNRLATLSGETTQFQREGMGSYPGINARIATIPGAAGISWAGEPAPRALPLIVETLLQVVIAYLLGLLAGRLWFRRRKRTSYLD